MITRLYGLLGSRCPLLPKKAVKLNHSLKSMIWIWCVLLILKISPTAYHYRCTISLHVIDITENYHTSILRPNSKLQLIGHLWCHTESQNLGAISIRKTVLPGMAIPMLKIRRPNGRLIFNMEIPYVDKTVFILRRGPGQPPLVQVMGYCLMTPKHYLNHWRSSDGSFTGNVGYNRVQLPDLFITIVTWASWRRESSVAPLFLQWLATQKTLKPHITNFCEGIWWLAERDTQTVGKGENAPCHYVIMACIFHFQRFQIPKYNPYRVVTCWCLRKMADIMHMKFQNGFLVNKMFVFYSNFIKVCSQGSNR